MFGNNYCPGLTKSPYSHSNRWLEYLLEIEPGNFTDPQTSYMDIGYEYWKLITCQLLKFYTSPRRHLSNFHLQASIKMRYLLSVSNPGILDKMKNWYKPEQVPSPHQSHTQDTGSPAEPCPSEQGPRGTSLYRISAMCVLCCLDILSYYKHGQSTWNWDACLTDSIKVLC